MARYIAGPSASVMERIQRAYQHRLYLIEKSLIGDPENPVSCEFFVLGATGNVYTVKLEKIPSCTCPDFSRGHVCKHLLFVYLRVLKLPQSDPRVWQKALLSPELQDLLEKSVVSEAALASQSVRRRFQEITGKAGKEVENTEKVEQRELDGDCPICYEPMAAEDGKEVEPVVFCRVCGNNVHRDCFQKWSRGKRGRKVTCIYCRAVWEDPSLKKKGKKKEIGPGWYINLASYSEDHSVTDTSLEALYPESYEWIRFG
ncbi:hypothetical protein O6H91_15G037700 [Diphasiastrum complanatum]|nr:hypothetical protein O6H91_15G037700 [Diphasiastrum complanatum]